jgi:transposase
MTSFLIVDAQSVKNTDSAEHKGYDAGKKVSGIKRHIAVDTQGFPHAIAVTTAEVTDRSGALQAIDRCKPNLDRVESVLVDGGYTGQPFADGVKERLRATVQVVKRNELHTFVVLPKRWVVERSFGWLEKCRRLWKNCERKLNTSLQFVHLAFLALLLRRPRTGSYHLDKPGVGRDQWNSPSRLFRLGGGGPRQPAVEESMRSGI